MKALSHPPGTIIEVDFRLFKHPALVSDAYGSDGLPTVIHNSLRFGGVRETTWTDCVGNWPFRVAGNVGYLAPVVLMRARSAIGTPYDLFKFNCDHFVRWACGLKPESPQLRTWIGLGLVGTAFMLHRYS